MAGWTLARTMTRTVADRVDALLVGGGVASVRCARTLRRLGFEGSIAIAGDEPRPPYNRPPLSKELLRDDLPEDLLAAESDSWYERRGIELLLGTHVHAIDLDAGEATLSDGSRIPFDRVLLATGAGPRSLDVPGGEAIATLRTADDARGLRRAAVEAGDDAPAVVIGGGLIGVEVASGLAALGLRPTVIELSSRLWGGALGAELAAWAAGRLSDAGVDVRLGQAATGVERGSVSIGSSRLAASIVVAGIGVAPRTELAGGAGLEVDGGVLIDADGRTDHPAAWAAGDVARVRGRERVEHWHAAREGGERAARSMLGMAPEPARPSWVFTEVAGVPVDVIGETTGDEERWLDGARRVLAFLTGDRVTGLASIDGALGPEDARRLVANRARAGEVASLIG
jgi:NADPH-dependent 2,4-dienoyl-CoA reductase/sulfur reductase-like enzyme